LPVRCYDDHHNLLTRAAYNLSHDELIACAYDDGTVGLLRLHSVCSSPQNDVEDTLVRLYDEHEDSVFQVVWSAFSPWVFASTTFNASSLVVNIVPNVEKYRILL
jgi:EARP and GARP complex-interacting protein 1